MKQEYITPKVVEITIDEDINMVMCSSNTNGAGKRPPGWDNPHNPHSKGINEDPFSLKSLKDDGQS